MTDPKMPPPGPPPVTDDLVLEQMLKAMQSRFEPGVGLALAVFLPPEEGSPAEFRLRYTVPAAQLLEFMRLAIPQLEREAAAQAMHQAAAAPGLELKPEQGGDARVSSARVH